MKTALQNANNGSGGTGGGGGSGSGSGGDDLENLWKKYQESHKDSNDHSKLVEELKKRN